MNAPLSHSRAKKSSKLGVFIVGVGVGFLGNWLFFSGGASFLLSMIPKEGSAFLEEKEKITVSPALEKSSAPVSLIAQGENTLVVSNQPAGNLVRMSMVSINSAGWVAIHEGDENNKVSDVILGARRFNAGKHFGDEVELLRNTQEGERYFAVLHADNNDSIFDYTIEIPLHDSSGDMVVGAFIATSGFSN